MASQSSESKASSLPAAPPVSAPAWSELLGPQLLVSFKEPAVSTEDLLKDVDFVLLYFSAAWCPPCQAFSPVLKVFYQSINDIPIVGNSTSARPTISTAVVYVSSDHSTAEFAKYYGTMPWYAIPSFNVDSEQYKAKLGDMFGIQGIPALVVLSRDRQYLDTKVPELRSVIVKSVNLDRKNGTKTAQKQVVDSWKSARTVPLNEVAVYQKQGLSYLLSVLMQNPAMLLALLYLASRFYQHYIQDLLFPATSSSGSPQALSMEDQNEFSKQQNMQEF
jgi:nucleoredoxin